MDYFPVFLDAKKLNVLIVGGGNIAARKLELMLKTSADIELVALDYCQRVKQLIEKHQLSFKQTAFDGSQLEGKNLVIAATDIESVNQAVYEQSKARGVLANVVDNPELCGYITPAIIDRDPMLVAISSSGSSPVLVRMLREQFEKLMPDALGKMAEFTFKKRELVQQRLNDVAERRAFWEQVLTGEVGALLSSGNHQLAGNAFEQALASWQQQATGSLCIIDVGDANPDNLTLAAHRQLQFADCVYFDSSLNQQLIDYVRRDADKVESPSAGQSIDVAINELNAERKQEKLIVLVSGLNKKEALQHYPELEKVSYRWLASGSEH